MKIKDYKTWLFDCDGVLLDSNQIKSDVFYDIALPYGKEYAEMLVDYHQSKGGVSRFEKLDYFFREILNYKGYQQKLNDSLKSFATLTKQKLLVCPKTKGVLPLLESLSSADKFVVSGGLQSELREVFREKMLSFYFEGIFGSPDNKEQILENLLVQKKLGSPSVFVGDSLYDYHVAKKYDLDFIFVSQYTEFRDWLSFFADKKDVLVVDNCTQLLI
jgi:phosphoglycolate phosphatase-like HAD superfamily hydrolase